MPTEHLPYAFKITKTLTAEKILPISYHCGQKVVGLCTETFFCTAFDWFSLQRSFVYKRTHLRCVSASVTLCVYHIAGSSIFLWDVKARTIQRRCDVTAVMSYLMGEDHSSSKIQLVSLSYHCSRILAATTSGYLIIVDAMTFAPVTCLRPHILATYRTLYSVLPLTDSTKYLTMGVGYRNAVESKSCDDGDNARSPVHVLSWYINPSESVWRVWLPTAELTYSENIWDDF